MKRKEVSTIMPVYNPKKDWLKEAVDSVLNQNYKNIELVIVNDGSNEPLEHYLKEEVLNDERVKTFYQENQGFSGATNTAIEKSQGDYIAPIGQDDIWNKDKLERQVKEAENANLDVHFVKSEKITDEGKVIGHKGSFPKKWFKELFFSCYPCYEGALYDSNVFEVYGKLDEQLKIASDWELWHRIWPEVDIGYTDESFVKKRYHGQNTMNDLERRHKEDKEVLARYIDNYPGEKDEVWRHHYRRTGKEYYQTGEVKKARTLWRKGIVQHYDIKSLMLYLTSFNSLLFSKINNLYSNTTDN